MMPQKTKNREPSKKELLRKTWNKPWTKQWLQLNTPFWVPRTLVFSETWENLQKWLVGKSCPTRTKLVIKPVCLSLSRGVRIIEKELGEALFRDALGRTHDIVELCTDLQSDLPGAPSNFRWFVEEYVYPPPAPLSQVLWDGNYNPLVRIIMYEGFHFGELHIPTNASLGRGTLRGGARRVAFNYRGELLQKYPEVPDDLPWNQKNYGTKIDVTGLVLPDFDVLLVDLTRYIEGQLAPPGVMFAIDGCYRESPKGPEFVVIEIEHQPNVRHLVGFNKLRQPKKVS